MEAGFVLNRTASPARRGPEDSSFRIPFVPGSVIAGFCFFLRFRLGLTSSSPRPRGGVGDRITATAATDLSGGDGALAIASPRPRDGDDATAWGTTSPTGMAALVAEY